MLRTAHRLLDSKRLTRVLLVVNLLVAAALAYTMRGSLATDPDNYVELAEGLLHGRFSPIWHEEEFVPETFRTPGYPLYLAAVFGVTGSWPALVFVQFALYALIIALALRTIGRLGGGNVTRNAFLLLMIPSINVPYYIPQVLPEIPALAVIAALLWADPAWNRRSWWWAVIVGLLYGALFQCRPVFLLLPLARILLDVLLHRKRTAWRWHAVMLVVYTTTLMPFALWNLRHHDRFSLTPLEGAGGIFQIGYWSGLIPGHTETRYWRNVTSDEMIRFTPEEQVPENIAAFEHDWDRIDSACAPFLTARDSALFAKGGRPAWMWNTFSTAYTLERERQLIRLTLARMRENPGYVIAWKTYSAVRLWVTGIQRTAFREAGVKGKLAALYPFLLTLGQFLLAVVLVPWALARVPGWVRRMAPMLLVVLYAWAIYLPFTIQGRYTIPLRTALLMLIVLAAAALYRRYVGLRQD